MSTHLWSSAPFLCKNPSVTADSGYESEEGYEFLKANKQVPYIKPQTYEKQKKRSFKKDIRMNVAGVTCSQ